jgi:CRP/FNR family transcriptional regulator
MASLTQLTNIAENTTDSPVFLAAATPDEWRRLERHALRRRFDRGETIVREGEVDRSLLIVLAGELEVVKSDSRGDGRVESIVGSPTVVGEVSFFDPGPRTVSLRARTDGELLQLRYDQFEALAAASPSLGRMILLDAARIVAVRLRRATGAVVE